MSRLIWDAIGEKFYEMGTKMGALYPMKEDGSYENGVAWNGLTAVTESPSGAEETKLYADDIKYASLRSAEEYAYTIEAYTYPEEWEPCDGSAQVTTGVTIGQQKRKGFGFSWVTTVGNDVSDEVGKKIHIAWNSTASPSEKSYYKTYNLTALQTAWKPLEEAIGPYRYYCDIEVAELTDRYTPFCTTSLETHVEAVTAGVAAGIETRNGCVRLFSILIPTGDVQLLLTLYGVGTLNYELTLPTGSWVKGENAFGVYPYYCDIPVEECTPALIPMGLTSLSEFEEAEKAGLATVMETKTGCLRFFAYTAPQKNIDVNVSLLKKEEPVNTPATRTELGLVMIGDGLNVSSAGSVTSRVASDKEFDAVMKQIYGS